MIIQSGNVAMTSRRSYDRTTTVSSSLSHWGSGYISNKNLEYINHYSETSDFGTNNDSTADGDHSGEDVFNQFKEAQSIGSPVTISRSTPDIHKIREESINYLLMLLFGKGRIRLDRLTDSLSGQSSITGNSLAVQQSGGVYTKSFCHAEQETTAFSTTGTVKTADGREINFNLSMTMSRSLEEAYTESAAFGAAYSQPNFCDPLVINLNTASANVTDQKFYFDLDADGKSDQISNLSSGSGFLALDKNGDGIINDGTELFGAQSGDGFADLAAYDEDGNGWIDENDSIFDKLRIWTKDASGKDVLCAIGKAGVGAIYLGNAQTEFSLNSAKDNSTNALVRKTGIFLYENGGCGTVQHLDMAT